MFFKIGVRNFAIFTGKHLCWSSFSINLQTLRLATLFKRDFNTVVFIEHYKDFPNTNSFFYRTFPMAAFVRLINNCSLMGIFCRSFLLNPEHNMGWFLRFVDLVKYVIYTWLVETIPTRFYWLNCRKHQLDQSSTLQQRLIVLIREFWQCRQVFLHYLMSILMICK